MTQFLSKECWMNNNIRNGTQSVAKPNIEKINYVLFMLPAERTYTLYAANNATLVYLFKK